MPAVDLKSMDRPAQKISSNAGDKLLTYANALLLYEHLRKLLPNRGQLDISPFRPPVDLFLPLMPSWSFIAAASDGASTSALLSCCDGY